VRFLGKSFSLSKQKTFSSGVSFVRNLNFIYLARILQSEGINLMLCTSTHPFLLASSERQIFGGVGTEQSKILQQSREIEKSKAKYE
jgi:hypothetical protein